MPCAKNKWGN
jgi:hypothetical protein